MPTRTPPTLRDRFRGCLLGLAVGDAVGAPFEGLPGETIYRDFGPAIRIISNLDLPTLTYTDDTQMAIAVAEHLLQSDRVDPDGLAQQFRVNYEADRGYGSGMKRVLDVMEAGHDWKPLVESMFPGGSFGNGAAMRVAAVGLRFCDDPYLLREQAAESAKVTHLHPLGNDGALLVASAIGIILREPEFDNSAFFAELLEAAQTEEFQYQIRKAASLDPREMISFGSSLPAHRSVMTAITCFTVWPDSYERAIARAIAMGEDTDTLAAIAGALSGAYLGIDAIPPHLLAKLENGPKGRDYIDQVAIRLYDKWAEPRG